MRKTYVFRLFPSHKQETLLNSAIGECRWLYNHLLGERKTAWEERQESLRLYDQQGPLPMMKIERPALALVHSQVLQNVAVRVDLAFKAFFRRVKTGEKEAGYPRFRGANRYDSFCYPQSGFSVQRAEGTVRFAKIGNVKAVLHRPILGTTKTCTVKRSSTGKWYVYFSCVDAPGEAPDADESLGIDVGLTHFANLSTGETILNPRFFRSEEKALAQYQRRLSKEAKGTTARAKRRKVVARIHERVTFRRHNFIHQESRKIVNRAKLIVVEDLSVNRMGHNHGLAKSIHDASWSMFTRALEYKAEDAGTQFVKVNPAYTSQTCSACGHRQKMPLGQRTYDCPCCGLSIDRDHNAALNILALGQQSLGAAQKAPVL